MAKKQEFTQFLRLNCWNFQKEEKIMSFNGLMKPAALDPYLLLAAVASSDLSFLTTFPAELRKVTACSSHVERLSTICCISVADFPAVTPVLWTAPLSHVHVLIMMVPRSISRLSWLPLLGLAQVFGSREIPANLFQRSLFFLFVKRLHKPATFWNKKGPTTYSDA